MRSRAVVAALFLAALAMAVLMGRSLASSGEPTLPESLVTEAPTAPEPHPERAPEATTTSSTTTTTTTEPPMPIGDGAADTSWDLVFADEFNAEHLADTWSLCYWWAQEAGCTNESNNNLQWYLPDAVSVADGVLRLTARVESVLSSDDERYEYVSGIVTSDDEQESGFSFQYGYVEGRLHVPSGKGLWSAFWMLPASHESRPEIDIAEILGDAPDTVEMHAHGVDSSGDRVSSGQDWSEPGFADDWHVYAIDWNPDRVVWYVDGIERWRLGDQDLVPAEPLYLVTNLAVGGDWPGAPDASTEFPAVLELDYVRVWQERVEG